MAYIGAEPLPGQNREVDDISSGFNGNTTAFTLQVNGLNVSPETANNILVNIGGVIQNPGTDYTIAASTITFTTAPASGLSFFAIILGAGINTATVADQTIGTSKILDNAITADKLAHTSVTAGSYTTADITVDAQGRITAAASGTISNAEIANNAVTTAKIADSTGASDGVTTAKLATDAVTAAKLASNSVVSDSIVDGSIVNADINASAAIAKSKLASLDIVNADVNGSAAIAASKIADFVSGNTNNRVLTATGTANSLNGEANLTFKGDSLSINSSSLAEFHMANGGTDQIKALALNGAVQVITQNSAPLAIHFATNNGSGTEKIRITTDGLTFNGDTAAANALDDYEEGYWSPTAVDGMTLHLQDSSNVPCRRYVKIGRIVTCFFDINWDSGNSSANFATRFAGLPFSVETGGHQAAAAVCIGFFSGAETDMLVAHIAGGLVKFFENGDAMYSYSESAGDRIAGFVTYTTT